MMPVALLPPVTGSTFRTPELPPLTEGPRYVRGPGNSRWHRPRTGQPYGGHIVWSAWCGQTVFDGTSQHGVALKSDEVPDTDEACGTCEGRAIGAGQDPSPDGLPALVFSPRGVARPKICPGSRHEELSIRPANATSNVLQCLVCGLITARRSHVRSYDIGSSGPEKHAPGDGLVDPCPWHRWQFLVLVASGVVGCSCGWRPETATPDEVGAA